MQIFTYRDNGQERSARFGNNIGLDFFLSAQCYLENQSQSSPNPKNLPYNLSDVLALGVEGLDFIQKATDWILDALPVRFMESENHGLIVDMNTVTLLPPIPKPGKVICIAGNYPAPNKMEKPEYPIIFLKPTGSVIGNKQSVVIPPMAKSVAYEVELAIVIGKRGKNLSPQEGKSIIAGYTIANDLGDRLLEKRTSQWTSGKLFDTFTPMGSLLITSDELTDADNLEIFTKVNGETVQQGNTSQMFFDVPFLVSYLSTLTTLEPGDVILTGSPKLMNGVINPTCELKHGDVLEVGIENFPSLMNPIVFEPQGVL
jgi:acylpyruvate hydrolase